MPFLSFRPDVNLVTLKNSVDLRSSMGTARSICRWHMGVLVCRQTWIVVVMDVAMLVSIQEQNMVFVGNLVTLLSVFITRQYVKNNAARCWVVRHLEFETILVLFCLQF